MPDFLTWLLLAIVTILAIGFGVSTVVAIVALNHSKADVGAAKELADEQVKTADERVQVALREVEAQRKEMLLQAKDQSHQIRAEVEAEYRERRAEVQRQERRIQQKEENLDRKLETTEKRERALQQKERELEVMEARINDMQEARRKRTRAHCRHDCRAGQIRAPHRNRRGSKDRRQPPVPRNRGRG